MRLSILIIYLICINSFAFAQDNFRIMSYEQVERKLNYEDGNFKKHIYLRYEFQKLFVKENSEWILDLTFKKNEKTNIIQGNKLIPSLLTLKTDTIFYLPNREQFYVAKKQFNLNTHFKTNFNIDWPFVKKLAFCTNNNYFKQNSTLRKYIPEKEDVEIIKTNLFNHLKIIFHSNCKAKNIQYSDTVLLSNRTNPVIIIDTSETFITEKGNKIIKFKFQSPIPILGFYPFNENCFREDNGYGFPCLTIYIDTNKNFKFLSDELCLLQYGDFDNNGEDEFIFWSSIFNHDKYVLYYNKFEKKTEYEWNYH